MTSTPTLSAGTVTVQIQPAQSAQPKQPVQYVAPNNKPLMMPTREDFLGIHESESDQKLKNKNKNEDENEYKSKMHSLTTQESKKFVEDNKLDQKYFDPSIQFYYLPPEQLDVSICRIFNRCWLSIYQLAWYLAIRIRKGSSDCFCTSLIQKGEIIESLKQIIVRSQNSIYIFSLPNCQKFEDDRHVCNSETLKKEMIEKDLTQMNSIYEKI